MGYLYGKGDGKMTRKGDPEKVLLGVEGDITTSAGPVAENDYRDRRANASGNPARFNQKIPSMHLLRNPRQKMGQRLGESPVPWLCRGRASLAQDGSGDKKGINHAGSARKHRRTLRRLILEGGFLPHPRLQFPVADTKAVSPPPYGWKQARRTIR